MVYLVLGLVVFLGAHSVRIVADGWRTQAIARIGAQRWKMAYSILSLAGFVLLVWGFGQARMQPVQLWSPPLGMRHAASLLTLVAFVFFAAAYVPGNGVKARVHHPMVLGVKVWALAHLLANGNLAHVALFGAFLAWAVLDFSSSRRRDRAAGTIYPPGGPMATVVTVLAGGVAWAVFAMWLHGWWIGVRPIG
jgi:uncharacterized membrane protein